MQHQASSGAGYNFDENMADPFGSKKTAVQNTPPGGGSHKQAAAMMEQPPQSSNFNDEFGA